jgi:hypothetical protein
MPKLTKIAIVINPGCKRAIPTADPMKGAVQGEATMTARTPVKKELVISPYP